MISFQSGSTAMPPSQSMESGEGDRKLEVRINFTQKFNSIPKVSLGIKSYVSSNSAHTRLHLYPKDISQDGFTLVFRTWIDTKVSELESIWIAFGESEDSHNEENEFDIGDVGEVDINKFDKSMYESTMTRYARRNVKFSHNSKLLRML